MIRAPRFLLFVAAAAASLLAGTIGSDVPSPGAGAAVRRACVEVPAAPGRAPRVAPGVEPPSGSPRLPEAPAMEAPRPRSSADRPATGGLVPTSLASCPAPSAMPAAPAPVPHRSPPGSARSLGVSPSAPLALRI